MPRKRTRLWLTGLAWQVIFACAMREVCVGQPGNFSLSPGAGAEIVQLLGAAEAGYYQAHGQYGTLAELASSGQLELNAALSDEKLRALHLLDTRAGHEPVAGFLLDLMVASDGTSYKLSLTPKPSTCMPGWFTDKSGMLYVGKPVGCDVASREESFPHDSGLPAGRATNHARMAVPIASSLVPRIVPRDWAPPDIDQIVPPVNSDTSCPLDYVLAEASKHAVDLVENLQSFSATEQIEHSELGRDGKRRNSQSRHFNYVAQIEQNPSGSLRVNEYRYSSIELPPTPIVDTGTAAFTLIFHPRHIANFEFQCEGLTELHGVRAWQVHFQETPDSTKSFHAIRIEGSVYQLRFKGRAWISAENREVLRLETDLVAPIPQIELQVEHLEITYAPVEFKKHNLQLWLPESATLYVGYHGQRYERIHSYSRFQLFWIDTDQTVKDPTGTPKAEH
jgi:hypothetical protein